MGTWKKTQAPDGIWTQDPLWSILTMWMFDAALAKNPHTGMSPLLNIEFPV